MTAIGYAVLALNRSATMPAGNFAAAQAGHELRLLFRRLASIQCLSFHSPSEHVRACSTDLNLGLECCFNIKASA